ncbi:MAG: beta-propeller domain-containing protein [Myxococcales bacterium]|nr:beta-propeller domain-containing protein [Myxococcales bacterium]
MVTLLLRTLLVGVLAGAVLVGTDNEDGGRGDDERQGESGADLGRQRARPWWWWRDRPEPEAVPPATVANERYVSADARAGAVGVATAGASGAGSLAAGAPGAMQAAEPQAPDFSPSDLGFDEDLAMENSGRTAQAAVVEGDIYRVLDSGMILNLNRYRGLQVIDVSDPDAPAVVGAYSVQGRPEEIYVRDGRAFVLLNGWSGYYGSPGEVTVERKEGGLLLSIDLSEPTDPQLLDSLFIPGRVRKSRMVTDGPAAALYVVSSFGEERFVEGDGGEELEGELEGELDPGAIEADAGLAEPGEEGPVGYYEWVESTVVTSYDVTGDGFEQRDQLDLGGYVQDIQATPEALLVATQDWRRDEDRNQVSLVDIGHADGSMRLGGTVRVNGYIRNQFNMDLHEGILRVVSTNWERAQTNVVETFDAHDIANLAPIDACAFGDGQDLYATLFLQNKAFFVTYRRVDPFHAFEIGADGHCEEKSEYVVSGWNDFFRAVASQTRLIGIGSNDEGGGQTPAVSLYDITDLANPEPLLARAQAGSLQWSWSEANFDHRAFSVLENVVSVASPDGTEETGMVLLPFSGYMAPGADGPGRYVSGVQIFTFSDTTVTARAAMEHDSEVRRSFPASESVTANLSEQKLALFDHTDPDAPEQLGSLDLAPDYGRVLVFGDYLARLQRPAQNYYYDFELGDGSPDEAIPMARVDLVPIWADPNSTDVIASFEVPFDARLLKAGDALAAISYRMDTCEDWPCTYTTEVALYDLSDPTTPMPAGRAKTDDLSPSYVNFGGNPYFGGGDFIGCGVGPAWFSGNQVDGIFALGEAVVFTVADQHQETIGVERTCSTSPINDCGSFEDSCDAYIEGYRSCTTIDDGPEVCRGEFQVCSLGELESACEPIDLEDIPYRYDECWEHPRERYWTTYKFKALDVRDLADPRFGDMLEMPQAEESTRVLPDGQSLYYTYRTPTTVTGDARPHVSYHFKELDFSDPALPVVGGSVNIPGELIAIEEDRLYTRDIRWGDERAESYLHELTLVGDEAVLAASHSFEGRDVVEVLADGDRLLVSHREAFNAGAFPPIGVPFPFGNRGPFPSLFPFEPPSDRLTVFSQRGLEQLGELESERYSSLEAAYGGRVLYSVPGGMMLFNLEDPSAPYAQAHFPVSGWPEQILFTSDQITVAAGRYGVHQFDADVFNLLTERP